MLACLWLSGCTSEPSPDRNAGPEAALATARAALHKHDLAGYYDALTDRAVLETLNNSIAICEFSSNPAVLAQMEAVGHNSSEGCNAILTIYGWVTVTAKTAEETERVRQDALQHVTNPREMAVALEENHRRAGAGSSFVWEWLDNVTIKNVVIRGNKATAVASWSGEDRPVEFERDASGWRITPVFEASP